MQNVPIYAMALLLYTVHIHATLALIKDIYSAHVRVTTRTLPPNSIT